jgi:hypothetical protein
LIFPCLDVFVAKSPGDLTSSDPSPEPHNFFRTPTSCLHNRSVD